MSYLSVLSYVGETGLYITLFYVLFQILFAQHPHFLFNRIFIMVALLFAFCLPFLHFNLGTDSLPWASEMHWDQYFLFDSSTDGSSLHVWLPRESIGSVKLIKLTLIPKLLFGVFMLGSGIFLIRYVLQIAALRSRIKQGPVIHKDSHNLVLLKQGESCFSFLNYIFIPEQYYPHSPEALIWHEQYHIQARHSLDLLIVEILIIVQWWNPFIHLFKKQLIETHEYMADQAVVGRGFPSLAYQKLLVMTANQHKVFLASYFNHSQLKKRLIMLNSMKQSKVNILKIGFLIFLSTMIICLNSLMHAGEATPPYPYYTSEFTVIQARTQGIIKEDQVIKPEELDEPNFIFPIKAKDQDGIGSGYGIRINPISKSKQMHQGIDIKASFGVDILAAADAIVKEADYDGNWGHHISLQHSDGFVTRYMHMQSLNVQKRDHVSQGQIIGFVGSSGKSTGPHLHFELWKNAKHQNPLQYLVKIKK